LQTLLRNDLVDELNISFFPLIIGKGKKLFGEGASPAALKLISSKTSGTGITINKYVRDGDIVTGSFEFEQPTEAELARRRNLT
jgi:dihydrofolate reductase